MKLSVVISIKNRTKLFRRTLKLFQKQSMPKSEFELVIVDDSSSEDIVSTLRYHAQGMNVKYIRIDSKLIGYPIYWGPSLSNNIGFKASDGEAIMITGPEILHKENNFIFGYESAMQNKLAFGHVFHSGPLFVRTIDQKPSIEDVTFDVLFNQPYAKVSDITHNTYYWFICAVKKQHILSVNGCDEEYMKGICGDDDDFANRIDALGVPKTHDFRMVGIHQDHSIEDMNDSKRKRKSRLWEEARIRNTKYLEDWYTKRNRTPLANLNTDWGSEKVILSKEQIYKLE